MRSEMTRMQHNVAFVSSHWALMSDNWLRIWLIYRCSLCKVSVCRQTIRRSASQTLLPRIHKCTMIATRNHALAIVVAVMYAPVCRQSAATCIEWHHLQTCGHCFCLIDTWIENCCAWQRVFSNCRLWSYLRGIGPSHRWTHNTVNAITWAVYFSVDYKLTRLTSHNNYVVHSMHSKVDCVVTHRTTNWLSGWHFRSYGAGSIPDIQSAEKCDVGFNLGPSIEQVVCSNSMQ